MVVQAARAGRAIAAGEAGWNRIAAGLAYMGCWDVDIVVVGACETVVLGLTGEATITEGRAGWALALIKEVLGICAGETVGGVGAGGAVIAGSAAALALSGIDIVLQVGAFGALSIVAALGAMREGGAGQTLFVEVVVASAAFDAGGVVSADPAVRKAGEAAGSGWESCFVDVVAVQTGVTRVSLCAGFAIVDAAGATLSAIEEVPI